MLNEICAEIKNYFTFRGDIHIGDFAISGGVITPSFDIPTNYIRIVGSHLNDGVHVRGENGFDLEDEAEFHGAVWVMSPPKDFLALVAEIEAWQKTNGAADSANMSPFQSESFGGYSYTKAGGGNSSGGGSAKVATWESTFASRLRMYRRISVM